MELTRELGAPSAATRRGLRQDWPNMLVWAAVLLFLVLVFLPIVYLLIMSLKSYGQIIDSFWALPQPWLFSNYSHGWEVISPYLLNTITLVAASTVITVV